jgi:hypothetical protein
MNIKDLAEQAGANFEHIQWVERDLAPLFERFAELVAAHEREECVKMFESIHKDSTVPSVHFSLFDTAYLIKTRGKA